MSDALARAAVHAFGTSAGPLRPIRTCSTAPAAPPGGFGPCRLFDVTLADGRRIALRLHAPARDRRRIDDGLRLAEALADAGLATPWPQRARDRALTVAVGDSVASALQWVAAQPLPAARPDPARLHATGALLADLHLTADAVAPTDLRLSDRRPAMPATVSPVHEGAADAARAALAVLGDAPTGVVLDDPGAVLAGADGLWLIGLDRAGTGWRAQDLAAALWPHVAAPDLPALRDALVAGYLAGGGAAGDAAADRIALCLVLRALDVATRAPNDPAALARMAALAQSLSA